MLCRTPETLEALRRLPNFFPAIFACKPLVSAAFSIPKQAPDREGRAAERFDSYWSPAQVLLDLHPLKSSETGAAQWPVPGVRWATQKPLINAGVLEFLGAPGWRKFEPTIRDSDPLERLF